MVDGDVAKSAGRTFPRSLALGERERSSRRRRTVQLYGLDRIEADFRGIHCRHSAGRSPNMVIGRKLGKSSSSTSMR